MSSLARFTKETVDGKERLVWYWVLGPRGAVSTWFSDVRLIIGRVICAGAVYHSPRLDVDAPMQGPCEFLEAEGWCTTGSLLFLEPVEAAFARGDSEAIYAWLAAEYERWSTRAMWVTDEVAEALDPTTHPDRIKHLEVD